MRTAALVVVALVLGAGTVAAQPAPRPAKRPAKRSTVRRPPTTTPAPPRCRDPIAGQWVATVWREGPERWDRVAVVVEREGTVLRGTITVTSWDGDRDQRSPPACADGLPAADRWRQMLDGVIDGSEVTWRGREPRHLAAACEPPGGGGYNPDHFTGVLRGELLDMTNDDGAADRGSLHRFRRTACP